MAKFEVVLTLEIEANSPKHAATIARDMMLDPDERMLMDVHPVTWCEEARDHFPEHDRGWQARFEKPGEVRPSDMIGWGRPTGWDAKWMFGT
jgi:hypothetical protein